MNFQGKGYPDVNTRFLVKKLIEFLNINAYILVDADPHGIEIMLTYKYGSLALCHIADELVASQIQWIGLKPTDVEELKVTTQSLNSDELKKTSNMLQRPYIDEKIRVQLETLERTKTKAEIESLYEFAPTYLVREFIPSLIEINAVV